MQKAHAKQLGFLPRMALVGKLAKGEVLIAEGARSQELGASQRPEQGVSAFGSGSDLLLAPSSSASSALGYLIAADRYFKRDEVGYVTQLCVAPHVRRSLVAAALLQAQYDRSAYGCRLYSCWCAQDLAANKFWEAMGYVPIAFRSGSRKGRKCEVGMRNAEVGRSDSESATSSFRIPTSRVASPRIHLFWQKKIRGDDDPVAYWFPHQTGGGALRADRIVFPIPPGTHWQDVLPIVLPEVEEVEETTDTRHDREGVRSAKPMSGTGDLSNEQTSASPTALPYGRASSRTSLQYPKGIEERDGFLWQDGKRLMTRAMILNEQNAMPGGMWFIPEDATMVEALPEAKVVKPKRKTKKVEQPIDPRLTAMARELRDRWHERPELVARPRAKHDVRRTALPEQSPTLRLAA
jgi:hypothetical protein